MIHWGTQTKTYKTGFQWRGSGCESYKVRCDASDTIEAIEKELRQRYSFSETYPGEAYIDRFGKTEADPTEVWFDLIWWSCD